MTTSHYKTILLKSPDAEYVVIHKGATYTPYTRSALRFPTHTYDLVLEHERYPEYLLIQDLPSKDIFNYFIENLTNDSINHPVP